MTKSRNNDTGLKLEVNDKILDNCTNLMKAIKVLILKSKELQKEIVAQGRVIKKIIITLLRTKKALKIFKFNKGASTAKEFYSKNHKWTEGLVSAAKLIGVGANFLM